MEGGALPGGGPRDLRPGAGHRRPHPAGAGGPGAAPARRNPGAPAGERRYRLEADLDAKAPTADEERNLGTGEWDARAGLYAEYAFWSATLFGAVGYNRLGDPHGLELEDVPDALLGVEREPFPPGIRLVVWVEGHPEVVHGAGERIVVAAGVGGADRHPWRLVVRAGLTEASEDLTVEAGYSLRPSTLRRRSP